MRLSLTRTQLTSAPAAELLSLLEEITGHGQMSEEDIFKLNAWILQHETVNLPAIAFLEHLLGEILSSGTLTLDARRSLLIEAERVLPADRREIARARRIAAESAEKLKSRTAKLEAKKQELEERELKRPVRSFNFMVAGVRYEGRFLIIVKHLNIGDSVYLAREPDNEFDANATAIRLANGLNIGYVPREHALLMAPLLDKGFLQKSYCTKLLGDFRVPVIVSELYTERANIDGAIPSSQIPPHVEAPPLTTGQPSLPGSPPATVAPRHELGIYIAWFVALVTLAAILAVIFGR